MNITIELNGTFYKVEAKNVRGETLLKNFIDGVVEVEELFGYEKYLKIVTIAKEW
jgi:hypothetical protein